MYVCRLSSLCFWVTVSFALSCFSLRDRPRRSRDVWFLRAPPPAYVTASFGLVAAFLGFRISVVIFSLALPSVLRSRSVVAFGAVFFLFRFVGGVGGRLMRSTIEVTNFR